MSEYEAGEIVNVTIPGARVLKHQGGERPCLLVTHFLGGENIVSHIPLDVPGISITRKVPAGGMPKPGEIWEDAHGGRWYVIEATGVSTDPMSVVTFVSPNKHTHWSPLYELLELGPMRRIWPDKTNPENDSKQTGEKTES